MAATQAERYCPIGGGPVAGDTNVLFGEWCCSEAYAEEYVGEVRAQSSRPVPFRREPTSQGAASGAAAASSGPIDRERE
jgi:hypothetical protein